MATVGIWAIKRNLKQVINYTSDSDKTDVGLFDELHNTIDYIENDFKTEQKLFVTGINCNEKTALDEMIKTKKRFHKENGILGFHAFHSYKEGEVTPEMAHKVGIQVATEMWGDRFQVLVSTHLNTNNIHNHFVINSVSHIDGKRYYDNRSTYAELRRISNEICKEYGLSYLEEKRTKKGINYSNYQNKNINFSNYYKTAKIDLDIAISYARTFEEFKIILQNMNYTIINRSGKLSIRNNEYNRNIRIERYFGDDYSIENINKQIKGLYIPVGNPYFKKNKISNNNLNSVLKENYKGLYGMYIHYLKLLKIYPLYVRHNKYPKYLKSDLNMMEELSMHARILGENKIDTDKEFVFFLNNKIDEFNKIKEEIEYCNRNNIVVDNHTIEKYNNLKNEIKNLKKIKKRKEEIKNNIDSFEKEKEVKIR